MVQNTFFDLLNNVLVSTKIGAWTLDIKTSTLIYYHPVLDEIYERYSCDYLRDREFWKDCIHPDDKVIEEEYSQNALADKAFIAEYRIITRNGILKWVSDRRKIVFDEVGMPFRLEGVVQDITQRKFLEEMLLHSENTYKYLFDNNPQPMWLYDIHTLQFLAVNQATVKHYGYSQEEFLSMTIKDIRFCEDIESSDQSVEKIHLHEKHESQRHYTKNGENIFVEVRGHDFIYKGKPARLVVTKDITEKIKADSRIRQLNRELKNFQYAVSSASMLTMFDPEGVIFYVNRNFFRQMDYKKKELLGKQFLELIDVEESGLNLPKLWKRLQAGKVWRDEVCMWSQSNAVCWADTFIVPIRDHEGHIIHFLTIQNDITQAKKQEEKIHQLNESLQSSEEDARKALQKTLELNKELMIAKERLSNAQKLANIGSWNWEVKTSTLYCSEQVFEIFGVEPPESYGLDYYYNCLLSAVHPNDREQVMIAHQATPDEFNIEYRIIQPNGMTRYVQELSTIKYNEDGTISHFLGTIQDITQRKQNELEIEAQNQILEEIAEVSSHIIRRPVASILGLVTLFDFTNLNNPFNAEVLRLLEKTSKELDSIIHGIVEKTSTINHL